MNFDAVYEELASGIDIIPALLKGVTQAEAQIRPSPESWSILEVVCHLYDEEREDFREHLDLILHRPNDSWKLIDPEGWVTARKYDERDLAEMLDNFLTERTRSLDWLQSLADPNWEAVYTTPYRTMTAGDMLCSWAAHDNLHMRQLVELRRARIERITQPYNVAYAGDW